MATYGLTAEERPTAIAVEAAPASAQRSEVWLDAVRIAAILGVIVLHACAPLTWNFDQRATWWVGNVFNSAARWCVPVFIMVSGALLLDPSRPGGTATFYRKRLARIGLPLLAWTLVYFAWVELRSDSPPSLAGDVMGVVQGRPYYHLWFLYMLVGLYLVTPVLRRFTAAATRRELQLVVAVLLALGVADAFFRFVLHVGQPNALTLFVPYVGYYLGGFLIRRYERPRRQDIPWLLALFVAALAATALANFLFYQVREPSAGDYMADYLSPTTAIASFALFGLFAAIIGDGWSLRHGRVARVITFGGVASFGVYLIHPMILEAVPSLLGWHLADGVPAAPVVTLLAVIALTFGLSLLATAVIQRVPGLRSLV